MGDRGDEAHRWWGTWEMGHMIGYNFFNTAWILTKILLDIDIDGFYLNTQQFVHDSFIYVKIFVDFTYSNQDKKGFPSSGHLEKIIDLQI